MNWKTPRTVVAAVAALTVVMSGGSAMSARAADADGDTFLKTSGSVIRDHSGTGSVVDLRGTNLGGWLVQEGWMSPNGQANLDDAGWNAWASSYEYGGAGTNAIDGSTTTRWSSGQPQVPGQYFVVDLGTERAYDQVSFSAGISTGDFPGGFRVSASNDNATWWDIAEGTATGQDVVTSTRATKSRYVAITLTTAKDTNWWSIHDFDVSVSDDYSTREVLTSRFGPAQTETLYDAYQDAWITTDDLDNIKATGMNTIRVPFGWQILMNDNGTMKPDEIAFRELDWVVAEAAERGLYVILDFHAAPGGACPWQSCGISGSNEMWANPTYQDWFVEIWQRIAERYKGNPTVAAYDLLNEPLVASTGEESTEQVREKSEFLDRNYDAVRAIDPDHIIFIPAFPGWDNILPPTAYGWTNVVYQSHHYNFGAWDNHDAMESHINSQLAILAQYRASLNVPIFAGEFWFRFEDLTAQWLSGLNDMHVSWTNWAYKVRAASGTTAADGVNLSDGWSLYSGSFAEVPDINADSAETIAAKWAQFATATSFNLNPGVRGVYETGTRPAEEASVPGIIQAERYSAQSGFIAESTSDNDGGNNLGWADAGDSAQYDIDVDKARNYTVTLRVASPSGASNALSIKSNGVKLANVDIPSTGGWQTWTNVTTTVSLPAGVQKTEVVAEAPGWNLNWISLS